MANMESIPNPWLPNSASKMAPRPESTFNTNSPNRPHNLLPAQHPPHNRLAQLRLDHPSRNPRSLSPTRPYLQSLRMLPRPLCPNLLLHSHKRNGATTPQPTLFPPLPNLHPPRPPSLSLQTNRITIRTPGLPFPPPRNSTPCRSHHGRQNAPDRKQH